MPKTRERAPCNCGAAARAEGGHTLECPAGLQIIAAETLELAGGLIAFVTQWSANKARERGLSPQHLGIVMLGLQAATLLYGIGNSPSLEQRRNVAPSQSELAQLLEEVRGHLEQNAPEVDALLLLAFDQGWIQGLDRTPMREGLT